MAGLLRERGGHEAGRHAAAPRVHLGIDTGMCRGGFPPEDAAQAARRLLDAGLDGLAGTWSHLASPEDPASVAAQAGRFEAALAALHAAGIEPGERHLDATGGLLGGTGPAYDLARVGLAFYGLLPPEVAVPSGPRAVAGHLRPALSLRARAATVVHVPAGTAVGYGGAWVAARPSVVATVALGYADGWTRAYAGGSWAIVRGVRVPVVGRIGSDAIALDATDVPAFGGDDEIALVGEAPAMTVHDLAALRGSISWEVLDSLAPRLSRVYVRGGQPVAVRYLDGEMRFATPAA
jgi:alanine racemase